MHKKNEVTQGKCCCCLGNRRGSRLVQIFDIFNFFQILRVPYALIALRRSNRLAYRQYYRVRQITAWLTAIILFMGLSVAIYYDVMQSGGGLHYEEIFMACFVVSVVVVGDCHFTHVIKFAVKHPDKNRPLTWIINPLNLVTESDSGQDSKRMTRRRQLGLDDRPAQHSELSNDNY